MSQYVVWYDSSEVGAPVLNNAAGSLIGVLDACLVNGFNLKSITSLVVAGGVATATCNSHGYSGKYSQDIAVAGCNTAALNGRKQLTYVDTNTFRFDATGVADQTATGTITAKRDALGWVKQFSGTNLAMYKRSDVTATSMMLRVLDTAVTPATTSSARAQMVESATDINTLTGVSPAVAQVSDGYGYWWSKGPNSATAKQWSVVGDGRFFLLLTQNDLLTLPSGGDNSTNGAGMQAFGDFSSYKAGDAYNTVISGGPTDTAGSATSGYNLAYSSGFAAPIGGGAMVVARALSQAGVAQTIGVAGGTSAGLLGSSTYPLYPSAVDGGYLISQGLLAIENNSSAGYPVRGVFKGVVAPYARWPMPHHTIINNIPSLPGRAFIALQVYAQPGTGQLFMDIQGPWA